MADLIVRDLRVARDGHAVLDGCDAAFPAGQRTVLWGRSGAGKSTLLGAVAGLLAPRSGTITLGPRVLFSSEADIDVPPHERSVGFVFQDLALWPHLTAVDQVRLVGRQAGLDRAGARSLLESVGLAGLMSRRPGQLSGGEQQRLALARALAGKPAMLLLDEPFSSVDKETRLSLRRLLREISPRVSGPTIYVTHDAGDAASLAESVVTLEGGKLRPEEHPWEGEEGSE